MLSGVRRIFYPLYRISGLILYTLIFCFQFFVLRIFFRNKGAVYLKNYIENCGGLFLKLGQLLAVRLDMIPLEYEEELRDLLACTGNTDLKPENIKYVKKTIEKQLDAELEAVFEEFDEIPVAWASIAQVHKAKLEGEDGYVAVKVMRSGVKDSITTDLLFLQLLAGFLNRFRYFRSFSPGALASELTRLTEKELNFIEEAVYIEEMAALMDDDNVNHCAPKIYTEYSREKVIVMEFLEGVWVSDLLEAVEAARQGNKKAKKRLKKWRKQGITPEETARMMFRSLMEQSCRYRFFHADPHPGNIIVRKGDGALQYVDFGMVGHLDDFAFENLQDLFKGMAYRDPHGVYEALIKIVEPLPPIDTKGLESEIKKSVADWMTASKSRSARMEEKSNGKLLLRAVDSMRRNRIQFPWAVMALFKATVVNDISVYRLDPAFDMTVELRDFFAKIQRNQFSEMLDYSKWQKKAYDLINSTSSISETVSEVSNWPRKKQPQPGRSYGQQMTRLEQGLARSLRDFGNITLSAGVLSGVLKTLSHMSLLPDKYNLFSGSIWIPITLVCLVVGLLSRRAARMIEEPF